jgi:hypothetical protein
VKITDIYLAGSAQVNDKVLKRCNCLGLGLRCLPSVIEIDVGLDGDFLNEKLRP